MAGHSIHRGCPDPSRQLYDCGPVEQHKYRPAVHPLDASARGPWKERADDSLGIAQVLGLYLCYATKISEGMHESGSIGTCKLLFSIFMWREHTIFNRWTAIYWIRSLKWNTYMFICIASNFIKWSSYPMEHQVSALASDLSMDWRYEKKASCTLPILEQQLKRRRETNNKTKKCLKSVFPARFRETVH